MTPDWRILGPLVAGMIALFGWIARHISNTKKHPCKDDIVFQDVCDERSKRLEDCIENEVEVSKERYETLTKKVDDGFKEVKALIRNNRNGR